MATAAQLRERAEQARTRALEINARVETSDEPSPDDLAAIDAAIAESDGLYNQADELDRRARALADLNRRASTPNTRVGRSPVAFDDGLAPPRDRMSYDDGDHPPLEGYSITRAIRGRYRQIEGLGQLDGLEKEWHDHLMAQRGGSIRGNLLIPWNAPLPRSMADGIRRRDLTTVTGAGAIPNDLVPSFLDLLRANLVMAGLGARVLTATGKFWYPKKTAGTTAYWVGEGVAVTESDITVGQLAFDPKTVGDTTTLSRKFLLQNEVGGEDMAIDDLSMTIMHAIEKAAINGSGTSAQPLGILQNSDVPTVAIGTNGGPLTYAKLVELANKPDLSNAPKSNRAFLFHPDTTARMESTPVVSGQTKMLYEVGEPDRAIGRAATTTTNVPSNLTKGSGTNLTAAIFGAWNQLAIVMFSGLDLRVNPYSEDREGNVRITMHQDVDLNVLYPEAFAKIVDITTTGWPS